MEPFKRIFSSLLPLMILTAVVLLLADGAQPARADSDSCINCHSDQERLKGLTQRWTKVYVDPEKFVQEAHGGLECITCHAGDPMKDTPEEACVGIAYKDPAAPEVLQKTCGSCHPEIAERHLNSIHSTLNGIRTSLHDFEGEEEGEIRFQESCNKCHATCSNCHMEQPGAHGILQPRVESHAFAAEAATDVCVACHDGTGSSYLGNPNIDEAVPSSMAEAGIECMACHVEEDVHGTGVRTTFLSDTAKPECQTCHNDPTYFVEVADGKRIAPQYDGASASHADHDSRVSCVACHTQWYQNCWSCHQGREASSNTEIYLAVNPLTGLVHTAVHSPATSPDWGSIPQEIGGGWAIKSRHSWGESQTCEVCHTETDIYITGTDREAPFIGSWGESRAHATFVSEDVIETILIDQQALSASVHGDVTCLDCHASAEDTSCSSCHTDTEKTGKTLLLDPADWSRTDFITARDALRQADALIAQMEATGMSHEVWSERWSELKQSFLLVSQDFHGSPGEAQQSMVEIAVQADALRQEIDDALAQAEARKDWLRAAAQFGIGMLGAVALVIAFVKPNNKKH